MAYTLAHHLILSTFSRVVAGYGESKIFQNINFEALKQWY